MANNLAEKLVGMMGGLLSLEYGKQMVVFIISLMPVLELRGGLLAASMLGMKPLESYILCIIGNILPIPFILWLINGIIRRMQNSKIKLFRGMSGWLHKKIEKNKGQVERLGFWGLVLFVAIPFPGTGAWTGALIASFLEMERKKALLACLIGILIASVIMMAISFGLVSRLTGTG